VYFRTAPTRRIMILSDRMGNLARGVRVERRLRLIALSCCTAYYVKNYARLLYAMTARVAGMCPTTNCSTLHSPLLLRRLLAGCDFFDWLLAIAEDSNQLFHVFFRVKGIEHSVEPLSRQKFLFRGELHDPILTWLLAPVARNVTNRVNMRHDLDPAGLRGQPCEAQPHVARLSAWRWRWTRET
jgi:hypothetical protein